MPRGILSREVRLQIALIKSQKKVEKLEAALGASEERNFEKNKIIMPILEQRRNELHEEKRGKRHSAL